MSRNWVELYDLQDRVLKEIASIDAIALGGGTGLNRFITKDSIRYSEDLDIFISPPFDEKNLNGLTKKIYYQISNSLRTSSITLNDGNTKRFMVENSLKIEILNSNGKRFYPPIDINDSIPLENPKELLLYKIAAISDRFNIRDLFDIWVLTREHINEMNFAEIEDNLCQKFYISMDYIYTINDFIKGVKYTSINTFDNLIFLTEKYQEYRADIIDELIEFKEKLGRVLLSELTANFNIEDRLLNSEIIEYNELKEKSEIIDFLEYGTTEFSKLDILFIKDTLLKHRGDEVLNEINRRIVELATLNSNL